MLGNLVPEGKVPVWEMNFFFCGHTELWQEYRQKGRSLSSSPLFCVVKGLRALEHFSVNVRKETFFHLSINQQYSVSLCNICDHTRVHLTAVRRKDFAPYSTEKSKIKTIC